jgi:tetratricopeptide (TPR) repeat protein
MNYNAMMQYKKSGEEKFQEGNFIEAEQFFQLALRETERHSTPNTYTIQRLKALGTFYLALGEFDAAESALKRGIAMERNLLGSENIAIAKSLNHLALLYLLWNKPQMAEDTLKQVLAIEEKSPFLKFPDVNLPLQCLSRHYLAMAYCKKDLKGHGRQLCKENAEKTMKNIGPGGRDMSLDLYQIAIANCGNGQSAEAQNLCEFILDMGVRQLQNEWLGSTYKSKKPAADKWPAERIVPPEPEYELPSIYDEIWRPSHVCRAEPAILQRLSRGDGRSESSALSINRFSLPAEESWRPSHKLVGRRN